MSRIEDSICEAIELIVNKAVNEASYDRTIQAIIKECLDPSIGKYSISYQDSFFYAYSTNPEITYSNGSMVYILVPGNDMEKDKTILGTVEKLGINYVNQLEEENYYDTVGTNCITSSNVYRLSSWRNHNVPEEENVTKTAYVEVIYNAKAESNTLTIDEVAVKEYLRNSTSLTCGAFFKTLLDSEQQYRGNYGIIFGLDFKDNAAGDIVTRYYTIDVDNMLGSPYELTRGKRQYNVFDIDGINFERISSISIFTRDFPNHKTDEEIINENKYDILISDIELTGAVALDDADRNGCSISFYTPEGMFFPANASSSAILPITAQVKVKGRVVDPLLQNISFYWFREDLSVVAKSEYYNKNGGRGWRCLNHYNVIVEADSEGNAAQVEWVPLGATYSLSIKDAVAEQTKLKCVAIYNGVAYSKTIIIKNLGDVPVLSIDSDMGTEFFYDVGRPNLTCHVVIKGQEIKEEDLSKYRFAWGREDMYGNVVTLPENEKENYDNYFVYSKAKEELEANKKELLQTNEIKNRIAELEDEINSYHTIQMIGKNQLLNVALNEITNFTTYKCSVFLISEDDSGEIYLGTASLKLTNSLTNKGIYTLIIHNGTQSYTYDEYGVSPASKSLENPVNIPNLTFSIYDSVGNLLDTNAIKGSKVRWKVPIKNSMLSNIEVVGGEAGVPDGVQEYQYYEGGTSLSYSIQDKYYYNYRNNDIELFVEYKGMNLMAKTNLSFSKQGEDGTNGTNYTCKIVPNSEDSNLPLYPTLTVYKNEEGKYVGGYFNFKCSKDNSAVDNFINDNSDNDESSAVAPFVVKLYESGEEIFKGSSSDNSRLITIEWEILSNNYKAGVSDVSDLTINKNSGKISYKRAEKIGAKDVAANIIKCTVGYGEGKKRYTICATLPIIIAEMENENYYIRLKENTGFRYVNYTSDGISPKYDNSKPFEIEVYDKNGNEVTNLIEENKFQLECEWWKESQVYDYGTNNFIDSGDLIILDSEIYNKNLNFNQKIFRPNSVYKGLCVNNTVACKCINSITNQIIGTIYIPIHFLLNKYGLAELNGWDGNSIQINEEGGYALAPKVGAGKKDDNNAFTGILMGEVQEPTKENSDIGLMGYNNGNRSFLLDAESGSAIFGGGTGKIAIDPSQNKALLYSGDFWNSENIDSKGLPVNYEYRDDNFKAKKNVASGKGLLIDLSKPEIYYGNGNFYVSDEGYAHIGGGGDIGGWGVDNHALYSLDGDGKAKDKASTGMSSSSDISDIFIQNIDGTKFDEDTGSKIVKAPIPPKTDNGNKIDNENKAIAFWAGKNKFYVTHDGYFRANEGVIGSGTNKIYIGASSVTQKDSNNKSYKPFSALHTINKTKIDGASGGFYLGVDGLGIGNSVGYKDAKGNDKTISAFQVNNDGIFYATKGYIGRPDQGWEITSNALYHQKSSFSDATAEGIYLGTQGISLGTTFSVNNKGYLTAKSGKIGNWRIISNALTANYGDEVTTLEDGKKTSNIFKKEKISGIEETIYLGTAGLRLFDIFSVDSSGNLRLKGTITGVNWDITSGGKATFNNIDAQGGKIGGATILTDKNNKKVIDGGSYSGGSHSGGSYSNGSHSGGTYDSPKFTGTPTVGDTELSQYIKNLSADSLDVKKSLKFQGKYVKWDSFSYVKDVKYSSGILQVKKAKLFVLAQDNEGKYKNIVNISKIAKAAVKGAAAGMAEGAKEILNGG